MAEKLWIKNTQTPPPEGWRYFVPETRYFVTSGSYMQLDGKVAKHCKANGVTPPTTEEITRFLCENLTLDCRIGRDPFPNKWTEANPEHPKEQPLPRSQWPFWVLALVLISNPEDSGIGDVIARTIGPINSAAFKTWYRSVFKHSCGCSERQSAFNEKYPLH